VNVAITTVSTNVSCYMLFNDGTLFVAGYNVQGQLGVNTVANVTAGFVTALNASLAPFTTAKSISANVGGTTTPGGNALIVDTSENVWTTGYNAHGELGQGTITSLKVFTQVTALSGIATAELGGGLYGSGYALTTGGTLYTWGYNGQNNLFLNSIVTPQP
jgi:alpha-tubulin suppressor-like RCC1 family protein